MSDRRGVRLQPDLFAPRHIGPRPADRNEMLRTIGVASLDALMDEAIPPSIRLERPLNLPPGKTEHEYLDHLRAIAAMNRVCKSYIGMGYYDCITPAVILRNVLENPGWYTPYTPYQAEIAQGRLESLLNFQTMVGDLTGMEIATASLLDEGTAAAEAMTMLYRVQQRSPGSRSPGPLRPGGASSDRNVFLASRKTFPQTLDVVRGRAEPLGIDVRVTD
ncbi:MAG: aminomethyl-transferring glycine dehydrogenase, partial [Vicinamibacterales bacterium]